MQIFIGYGAIAVWDTQAHCFEEKAVNHASLHKLYICSIKSAYRLVQWTKSAKDLFTPISDHVINLFVKHLLISKHISCHEKLYLESRISKVPKSMVT